MAPKKTETYVTYFLKDLTPLAHLSVVVRPKCVSFRCCDYLTKAQLFGFFKKHPLLVPSRFQIGVNISRKVQTVTFETLINWMEPTYNIVQNFSFDKKMKKNTPMGGLKILEIGNYHLIELENGTTHNLTDDDIVLDSDLKQIYPPKPKLKFYQNLIQKFQDQPKLI